MLQRGVVVHHGVSGDDDAVADGEAAPQAAVGVDDHRRRDVAVGEDDDVLADVDARLRHVARQRVDAGILQEVEIQVEVVLEGVQAVEGNGALVEGAVAQEPDAVGKHRRLLFDGP